jgi:hypothetical protein
LINQDCATQLKSNWSLTFEIELVTQEFDRSKSLKKKKVKTPNLYTFGLGLISILPNLFVVKAFVAVAVAVAVEFRQPLRALKL